MGNQSSSSGDGSLRSRMSLKKKRDAGGDEYSQEDIRLKFQRMPRLNEEEIKVIKSSWKLIQKKVDRCGAETFLRMFEQHPDTKAVFTKFQGLDLVALEQSMEIKEHGERVMMIIDRTLTVIDNPHKIWDILIGIGRRHFGFGALPMYFDLMGPHCVIAIRSCLENDWYEALEYHWLAVFNMVVYVMKFGWNLQRAEEQKRARNNSSKRGVAS